MSHFIKEIREATNLSQSEFAKTYHIPLSTLRKWEQLVSFPPKYVVELLEASIPAYNKNLIKIVCEDNNVYYLNKENKKIFDNKRNCISFDEPIDGVIEANLPVYIKELFDDFYKIQNQFNRDLFLDKKEKIIWR